MKKYIKKLQKQFSDPAKQMYALAGLAGVCAIFLLIWFSFPFVGNFLAGDRGDSGGDSQSPKEEQKPVCAMRHMLSGACVKTLSEATQRVVAVMVENSQDAWPLSGLSRASLVYEAPAEANIPRFVAFYMSDTAVDEVGPVRSARPYFVDWVGEYPAAMYMHVGGSPDALEEIIRQDIFDINEMTRGWYFWRDENRRAPHNTYTSTKLWTKAIEAYGSGIATGTLDSWMFEDREPCAISCVNTTTIRFAKSGYSTTWRYNPETGKYDRFQMHTDTPDTDTDGTVIAADTIIVQRVSSRVLDAIGRLRIDTIGEGEAMVLRDGYATSGRWKKPSRTARTQWVDVAGNQIPLKGGTIWIEVVPQDGTVE